MKKYTVLFLTAGLLLSLLSGCGDSFSGILSGGDLIVEATKGTSQEGTTEGGEDPAPEADFTQTDAEMFTERDHRATYDEADAVKIELKGSTAAASSSSVKINGSTVQLTEEATYVISGTLDVGMLVVNAPDTAKVQLVFKGVNITSSDCAALYILAADKVFLTLVEGTTNSLTNGGSFTALDGENIDAALYAKQDLTINGAGQLTVTSPAGHGIVGKDDLVITGGVLQVSAASHALDANDSVRFTSAMLTATAGKDGIHCQNNEDNSRGFVYISGGSMNIEAEGDGISAGYYLHITDGALDILAGGGYENGTKESSGNWGGFPGGGSFGGGKPGKAGSSGTVATDDDSTSMKGIKSAGSMLLAGGSFTIDSADDSLHSDTSMTVSGGTYQIASGDDAIHAEEELTVKDGTIRISNSYEGLEAQHITVTGGDINLTATDDGLNAAGGTDSSGTGGRDDMFGGGPGGFGGGNSNGSIAVSGGTLYINSSGDGIDANGTLEISGGHITIVGPTTGDTATLDYDVSGSITGGTFIGTGSSMMAQSFSSATQGVIAIKVDTKSAGTQITLKDKKGNTIISHAPELSFQVVILSSPDIVSGETYTLTVGSLSDEIEAY